MILLSCPECRGRGVIVDPYRYFWNQLNDDLTDIKEEDCEECNGRGVIEIQPHENLIIDLFA